MGVHYKGSFHVWENPHCTTYNQSNYFDSKFVGIDCHCITIYRIEVVNLGAEHQYERSYTSIDVKIDYYNKMQYMYADLSRHGRTSTTDGIIEMEGKGVKLKTLYWINDSRLITIDVAEYNSNYRDEVDDIINDYLKRYPQDKNIEGKLLTNSQISNIDYQRRFDLIEVGEEMRKLDNKQDKYIGSVAQCEQEVMIRSLTGKCNHGENTACTIAMIDSAHIRKTKFKELEEQTISNDRKEQPPCQGSLLLSNMYTIAKKNKLTEKDFEEMKERKFPDKYLKIEQD